MPHPVDAVISELLAEPVTLAQLRQDAPHTAGLSTADAERVRAHLLASFETRGIPLDALPVVAEELRSSASPVVLAGAARAVRGLGPGADGSWAELLRDAADRVATADVYVRWVPGAVAPSWMRTARGELLATLEEVAAAPAAPADLAQAAGAASVIRLDPDLLARIATEDQDGGTADLGALLAGRETVLAFFYTRCMNPARCSLTITRLAAAARGDTGRAHLAMTYDPAYDSPARLRRYGEQRAFPFGERARLVRTPDAWLDVRAMFGLRVGYGPATVNEHARELFLVGPDLVARGLDPDAIA
ncbi:SCO family protein [Microbacterium sp. SS28]|uniref:SCO family protein n=1 Tax=Microbacterium sp. SS28 TaxID=2919948 RepID=UPI001FA97094|nr:SCO family protein [Microbacterium sp. SS28]